MGAFRAWLVKSGQATVLSRINAETVQAYLAAEDNRRYRIASGEAHRREDRGWCGGGRPGRVSAYPAQQDSFSTSLKNERATIFRASAIVG